MRHLSHPRRREDMGRDATRDQNVPANAAESFARTRTYRELRKENNHLKTAAFHTTSPEYPPTHRNVYHDRSECRYGQEIKRDGKDVAGEGGRPRCDLCKTYG